MQLAVVVTQDRFQEDLRSPSGQLTYCVSSRSQRCLLGMSGPHTRALSPDPGIAQARLETGELGPSQGGVEAFPENVFRLSQSRWGAVIPYRATAAAGEEAQVPPHQKGGQGGQAGPVTKAKA